MIPSLLLVLSLSSAAAAPATPHPILTRVAIAAACMAQFADVATTEYAMGTGRAREANPIVAPFVHEGPIAAAVVKGAIWGGVSYALVRAHRTHPKGAIVAALAIAAGTSAVAWHNAHLTGAR